MQSLSIVVPVFNEIENLEALCQRINMAMADLKPDFWEAVLVNDGSTDGTGEWLQKYCKTSEHFRAVHFKSNQGQTAAFDAGIQASKGEFIVTMDADLQNDPNDIANLWQSMEPHIGIVCGVRVKRQDNWLRKISSRIANGVRNWITQEKVTDTGCSLKMFRRKCFDRMPMFEGMHRFFPSLVKMAGFESVEVPVSHHPRHAGTSKYGVWNRVFRSFFDLLAVRWMKKRALRYEIIDQPDAGQRESQEFPSSSGSPSKIST